MVHYPLWRLKTRDEDIASMASIIALRVSQVWLVVARIAGSYSLLSSFS